MHFTIVHVRTNETNADEGSNHLGTLRNFTQNIAEIPAWSNLHTHGENYKQHKNDKYHINHHVLDRNATNNNKK